MPISLTEVAKSVEKFIVSWHDLEKSVGDAQSTLN